MKEKDAHKGEQKIVDGESKKPDGLVIQSQAHFHGGIEDIHQKSLPQIGTCAKGDIFQVTGNKGVG